MILHEHLIDIGSTARAAFIQLDALPTLESRTLFVIDCQGELVGTLTDGDIRRGLLAGFEISDSLGKYVYRNFKAITESDANDPKQVRSLKNAGIRLLPVINSENKIIKVVDFASTKTLLPLTAIIMAGGRGERLRPLTDNIPKPMLCVGNKPIIEINIDRLISYGVEDFFISIKYLGNKIKEYLGDGSKKNVTITYIEEDQPLGTLGSLGLIKEFKKSELLIMNSDILTNIDFEDFYYNFSAEGADMMVASVPYHVRIPYGIMQLGDNGEIRSLVEKPTYSYYSNAGIYLLKTEFRKFVKGNIEYNATDLMDQLISDGMVVKHYPILNYWLDIGKHEDFIKAQIDIKHISL